MNKNYLNNVRLRERRLSAHKCLACGKQLEEDYTSVYCEICREKRNKNAREEREWYQSHKICPRCRKVEIGPNESCCPECRAKLCANVMKNRKREQYNEEHAIWSKKPMQIVLKMVFAHVVIRGKLIMATGRAESAVKKTEQLGR